MASYFGGGDSAAETPADPVKAIDQATLTTLITNIENEQYERRPGKLKFRKSFGLGDYIFRTLTLMFFFCIAFFPKADVPRHKEDAEWLRDFSLVMIVWFTFLHTMAYMSANLFGSFDQMMGSITGNLGHAYNNWREWQYVLAFLCILVMIWPFLLFFAILHDGFNPYEHLTKSQITLEGDLFAQICYLGRVTLHIFMVIASIYMVVLLVMFIYIRSRQKSYPGQYTWMAKKLGSMPYGDLFFQSGEYYDCGICIQAIYRTQKVVRCMCDATHTFHADCLRTQVSVDKNYYCVMCTNPTSPIMVKNKPGPDEYEDNEPIFCA